MAIGWIKLHRRFLKWEWYSDTNTSRVFLHLLLTANYEDSRWKGFDVKRGQVITGRHKLAKDLGLTERAVRTALTKLKTTNEVSINPTKGFSIITIEKYEEYQSSDEITTNEVSTDRSGKRPTSDQRATTSKELKKERSKEDKKGQTEIFVEPFILPEFIDIEVWDKWILHRKEKRKSINQTQAGELVKKLKKLHDLGEDVNECILDAIANGYQGIFAIKKRNGGNNGKVTRIDALKDIRDELITFK